MIYWLIELPYKLSFRFIRFLLDRDHDVLWPRHSYLTRDLVFLVSDLDLTLLVDHLDRDKCLGLRRLFKRLNFLFPHLGEMNIFSLKLLKSMGEIAPILELQRDPHLLKWLNHSIVEPSPEEKLIFYKKMYLADRHNLERRFKRRVRKWTKHLASLDVTLDSTLLSKEHLDQIALKQLQNASAQDEFLLDLPHWLADQSYQKDWLNPDFDWPKIENLKLLEAALCWEIWGAYHQFVLTNDELSWFSHVDNCRMLAQTYGLKIHEQKAAELLEFYAPLMGPAV